jgi:hypothetical protein
VIDDLPQACFVVQREDAHGIATRARARRVLVPCLARLGLYPPSAIWISP